MFDPRPRMPPQTSLRPSARAARRAVFLPLAVSEQSPPGCARAVSAATSTRCSPPETAAASWSCNADAIPLLLALLQEELAPEPPPVAVPAVLLLGTQMLQKCLRRCTLEAASGVEALLLPALVAAAARGWRPVLTQLALALVVVLIRQVAWPESTLLSQLLGQLSGERSAVERVALCALLTLLGEELTSPAGRTSVPPVRLQRLTLTLTLTLTLRLTLALRLTLTLRPTLTLSLTLPLPLTPTLTLTRRVGHAAARRSAGYHPSGGVSAGYHPFHLATYDAKAGARA